MELCQNFGTPGPWQVATMELRQHLAHLTHWHTATMDLCQNFGRLARWHIATMSCAKILHVRISRAKFNIGMSISERADQHEFRAIPRPPLQLCPGPLRVPKPKSTPTNPPSAPYSPTFAHHNSELSPASACQPVRLCASGTYG